MPPRKRKVWEVRTIPVVPSTRCQSMKAAYEHVQRLAEQYTAGTLRQDITHATVWVQEDGQRWQRYEMLSLAALASSPRPAETKD